jgi:hypothetical protein
MKRALTDDGQDITEPVQILYDIAHSSMDWGSGFLDNEEMEAVIQLAITMGWEVPSMAYTTAENAPMVSVARKFPEQYDVQTVKHPPSAYHPEGWETYRVTVRA